MDKNKKILVVFGGPSSEAEVSKRTANGIFKALQNLGYKTELLEFGFNFSAEVQKIKPDVVYNAMHGAYGEDGALQGLLECLRIPYTLSGVRASAIAMDKALTKDILNNYDVDSASGRIISREELLAGKFKKPCVIKPIADGSSVGVIILKQNDSLNLNELSGNDKFLVEDFIEGRELTVGVLDGKAMGSVEIRPKSGVYDYKSKYTSGATEYISPAPIPENIAKIAYEYAEKAHNILGCKGVTRSDMIYNEKEHKVYFLEINTHPGMTETSLVPKIAASKGMSYEEVVDRILNTASLEIMANK